MINIVNVLRIKHYIKNLVVLVPLIISLKYRDFSILQQALVTFISFCFVSSSVYIFNDLIDKQKDKKHPTKQNRPIASGKIKFKIAVLLLILLLITSVTCANFVNFYCVIAICSYFALNICYSLFFKHIAILDMICISMGFILRMVAGYFAINTIPPSNHIFLLTFCLSMFFTGIKRILELENPNNIYHLRKSLIGFPSNLLNSIISIMAIFSIVFYIIFIHNLVLTYKNNSRYLYLTVALFIPIIIRLCYLIQSKIPAEDSFEFFQKDFILKCIVICYALTIVFTYKIIL